MQVNILYLLLLGYVCLFWTSNADDQIFVTTTYGDVVGLASKVKIPNGNAIKDGTVISFLGIPFAAPPLGKLRFKAPVSPKPWAEKLLAYNFSRSCAQLDVTSWLKASSPSSLSDDYSEDCLYLNVWVPYPVPEDAAVLVWIYGGAFSMGNTKSYDWAHLAAKENIIVVSMNYRITSLGFLYFDSDECPGNMGLRDQDFALKWVQENIDRFGGDPKRVTIYGQSAGSGSTGFHLLNPNSQHLFQRAILGSGTPYNPWAYDTKKEALLKSNQVAQNVGCGSDLKNVDVTLNCLRNVKAEDLVLASAKLGDVITMFHVPVLDNKFAFEDNSKVLDVLRGKEVLMGFTSNDGAFLINALINFAKAQPNEVFQSFASMYLGNVNENVMKLLSYYYKDHCDAIKQYSEEIISAQLSTDYMFLCGTYELADELAAAGVKTYLYQMKYRPISSTSPVWVEADHGAEIIFILGASVMLKNEAERELSQRFMEYWGSFVKYGDPNIVSGNAKENRRNGPTNAVNLNQILEPWPEYTLSEKLRFDIDLSHSLRAFGALQKDQCFFWKNVYPIISRENKV